MMMALPVVLAVDEDQQTLGILERQLTQRYSYDYRVECLVESGRALLRLTELADRGEEVALVLAANSDSVTSSDGLLVRVRELHPHAKCALVVPADVWADKSSANEVRALVALGRVHYYVVRPAGAPDEVFHDAISSFFLEWATERRTVPHTIHIVGES
jgi:thioredoxin reductase (NADPH)